MAAFATETRAPDPLAETWLELNAVQATLRGDITGFAAEVSARAKAWAKSANGERKNNSTLHAAREGLHDMAEQCRDLTKQVDLAARLARRVADVAIKKMEARASGLWANADVSRARKALEGVSSEAVEALLGARYFVKQADWLQERFPEAELRDVKGLVKRVDRAEIAEHDWSLTPGRYVGVAPEEQDEDFDFEEALRSIHIDLAGLNEEASALAARIAQNFEELSL